ncbi:MAG: helix-turn-helix domain-containing protein [Methylomonas sp.]
MQARKTDIAKNAQHSLETVLIETAPEQAGGHRRRAAKLLGYGGNTLSRKIQELQIDA